MTTMSIEPYFSLELLEVGKSYFLRYYDADASNLDEALDSVERGLEDLGAFLVAVGSSLKHKMHHKALMEVLKKPLHANTYKLIAKRNPYVLVAIAVGIEANMMSIEPGTELFEGVDFLQFNGDEEEVIIALPLTGPSPEKIRELSDRFKPLTGEDLPKGDINSVITFVFNKINIPIEAQPGNPVVFNLREFSDTLGALFVGQSDENLRAKPPSSFYDMTSELDADEWSPSCAARMVVAKFPFFGLTRINPLRRDPVPPRDVAYPEVAREICNGFDEAIEKMSKDMLTKSEEEGGDCDGDVSKQPGDNLLAGPSDGQIPASNLTAGPTISSPPNAERPCAEAGDAERPSSELNLLEVLTACECNATEAHESLASGMSSNPASDEERFAALKEKIYSGFEAVHTSIAAFRAELENFRTSERQRSAEAGPQTSAHNEGDASDALGASPQVSQQYVHGMALVPFEQGRNAQEALETGNMGSETSVATGYVNAGAIPRLTTPDYEHKEDGEEAQAEVETDWAYNHDKLVVVTLVKILLLLGYFLSLDSKTISASH